MSTDISSRNGIAYLNHEKCADFAEPSNYIKNSNEAELALAALRLALLDIPQLIIPSDDEFLVRFLRTKNFVVEDALKILLQYFDNKRRNDDLIHLTFSDVKHFYDEKIWSVLPERHNGANVLYIRISLWDPEIITIEEFIMTTFYLMEEITSSKETQIHGVILLFDIRSLTFTQMKNILKQLTLRKIKLLLSLFQGGYPAKFKGVHVIANSHYFFNIVFGMISPFLKDKLRKRVHFHGKDLTSLHNIISQSILPEILGGLSDFNEDLSVIQSLFQKEKYFNDLGSFGWGKKDL